jgi:hypothetical protein
MEYRSGRIGKTYHRSRLDWKFFRESLRRLLLAATENRSAFGAMAALRSPDAAQRVAMSKTRVNALMAMLC